MKILLTACLAGIDSPNLNPPYNDNEHHLMAYSNRAWLWDMHWDRDKIGLYVAKCGGFHTYNMELYRRIEVPLY